MIIDANDDNDDNNERTSFISEFSVPVYTSAQVTAACMTCAAAADGDDDNDVDDDANRRTPFFHFRLQHPSIHVNAGTTACMAIAAAVDYDDDNDYNDDTRTPYCLSSSPHPLPLSLRRHTVTAPGSDQN